MSQVRVNDMVIFISYETASICCSEGYLLQAWAVLNKALEYPTTFETLPKHTCQLIENLMQKEAVKMIKKIESLIKKLNLLRFKLPEKKSRLVDLSYFSEEYIALKKKINKAFTSPFPITKTFPYIDEMFNELELFRELIQTTAQKNIYYRACDLGSQRKFSQALGLLNNAFKKTPELPEFIKKQKERLEENSRQEANNKESTTKKPKASFS